MVWVICVSKRFQLYRCYTNTVVETAVSRRKNINLPKFISKVYYTKLYQIHLTMGGYQRHNVRGDEHSLH